MTKPLSKKEAIKLDAGIRSDLKNYRKAKVGVQIKAAKFIEGEGWIGLGMPEDKWAMSRFGYSASHLRRRLHDIRALKALPAEKVEAMHESNAHLLARAPAKQRSNSKVVKAAIEQKPRQFKETLAAAQGGAKAETWKTFAVRVPETVYDLLTSAQDKMAAILQLDLSDEGKRPGHLIAVWEAIANLVNQTDESRLKTEVVGGE